MAMGGRPVGRPGPMLNSTMGWRGWHSDHVRAALGLVALMSPVPPLPRLIKEGFAVKTA